MKSDRTEDEFVQQLTALFAAQGISVLTIGAIAAALKCSRRRLYALAPTKEALFLGVARRMLDQVVQQGHEAARNKPDLAQAIQAYLQVGAVSAARLSVAFLTDLEASDEGRKLFDEYQLARASGLEQLIQSGVEQGVFAPHDWRIVAQAILGASQRLRRPVFLTESGISLEQAFEALYELMLHGLMFKPEVQNIAAPPTRQPGHVVSKLESWP